MTLGCYLRRLGYQTCNGRLQRAHMIPKQRIKQAGITDLDVIWDERVWRHVCSAHHHALDMKFIYLTEAEYPESVGEWAAEHGFYFLSPSAGWRKEADA